MSMAIGRTRGKVSYRIEDARGRFAPATITSNWLRADSAMRMDEARRSPRTLETMVQGPT